MSSGFAVADLAPFTHGPQRKNPDDCHANSGNPGSRQQSETAGDLAGARALKCDEGISDQGTGQTAEQDAEKGDKSGRWRWQR
jgi:hypothetical protein